ncbi:MAG: BrnT family toxin [Tepidisphaeraceae bacterium]|jgi:hypothetical protein
MPRFEFDPIKSEKNRLKHGIDFVAAQEIWDDRQNIEAAVRGLTEPRFQVLGRAQGKLWSAVITYRPGAIRIISVRRARLSERRKYEKETRKKEIEAGGGGV